MVYDRNGRNRIPKHLPRITQSIDMKNMGNMNVGGLDQLKDRRFGESISKRIKRKESLINNQEGFNLRVGKILPYSRLKNK